MPCVPVMRVHVGLQLSPQHVRASGVVIDGEASGLPVRRVGVMPAQAVPNRLVITGVPSGSTAHGALSPQVSP